MRNESQDKLTELGYKGGFEVMELLDYIRVDRRNIALRRYTEQEDCPRMGKIPKSLPDYLAEFVIFDIENNFITLGKKQGAISTVRSVE